MKLSLAHITFGRTNLDCPGTHWSVGDEGTWRLRDGHTLERSVPRRKRQGESPDHRH